MLTQHSHLTVPSPLRAVCASLASGVPVESPSRCQPCLLEVPTQVKPKGVTNLPLTIRVTLKGLIRRGF